MPVNIVLDTNIWVSYFINARADYLVKWIIERDVDVFTSPELAAELEEVLLRPKFNRTLPFPVTDFVQLHLKVCTLVTPSAHFNIAPDPDDNFLFDLCKKCKATLLITSDKRLLQFTPPLPLEIISFNELRTRFP